MSNGDFEVNADSTPIIVSTYTNYNYKHDVIQNTQKNRARDGTLYTYKYGTVHHKFTLPLHGVSSSHATTINSWWQNNELVNFTENNSMTAVLSGFACKIINKQPPLIGYVDAQFSTGLYKGTLILESI